MQRKLAVGSSLAALLGMAATYAYVERFEREATGGPKLPVVVLLSDVPTGTALDRDVLGTREIPEAYRDSRHIEAPELERLVGARLSVPGRAHEAVLWTDLASVRRDARQLSDLVPEGMRAITLAASASSFGGLITPGDRVDVLGTFADPQAQAAQMVAHSLLVLAVGDQLESTETARRQGAVTLSASLEQASAIAAAERKGSLRLVLRHPDDLGMRATSVQLRNHQTEKP
jgi:Flp pilus assembly protein CpaB